MNILIAAASKHGSTNQIAQVIADELKSSGANAQLLPLKQIEDIDEFDAVLLGSAVYYGKWRKEAKKFAEQNSETLKRKAVWLFSSGPLGENDPHAEDLPLKIDELIEMTGARGHTVFIGSLDKDKLGFAEKLIIKGVKAPYGDFRDWNAIRGWAAEIAESLGAAAIASAD